MGDKEYQNIFGGGKLCVIAHGEPIAISLEPVHLNIEAQPATEQEREAWQLPKSFTIEGNVFIDEPEKESLLERFVSDNVTVTAIPNVSRLPRKWKKAANAKYRRQTKWKRKAARWLERNTIRFTGQMTEDEDGFTISGKREG